MDPLTKSIIETTESDAERLQRYQQAWRYYWARAFFSVDEAEAKAIEDYLTKRGMFKEMRDVFSCIGRAVDTDARFVMKQKLTVEAEDRFAQAIEAMWERGNLQAEKYKLVRFGAALGDAYLYLLPSEVGPRLFVGNTEDWSPYYAPHDRTTMIAAKQSYVFIEAGKEHVWDRIFYPDRVETYIDEKLQNDQSFVHPFGEVPVIHCRNLDTGERFGASSWEVVHSRVDVLNEFASYMRRIIFTYADPTLLAKNVEPPRDASGKPVPLQRGVTPKGDNIMYIRGQDADMKPIEFQGNVLPQVLEFVKSIYDDIKEDLPELALAKIRDQAGLSGYSVNLQLADVIAKIGELRGNYGNGLEWANQLALRAVFRSNAPLEEFQNRVVFEPVLPEDRSTKLANWKEERGLGITSRREILREEGLTDDESAKLLQEIADDEAGDVYGGRLRQEAMGGQTPVQPGQQGGGA